MQIRELGLGNSATDASVWKVNYEYGELADNGTDVIAGKNTGNIAKQTISFNGLAQPFVQTYKYDSLYRLTEAKETTSGQQNWIQGITYDRFGNRATYNQVIGVTQNGYTPGIDQNTNRFNLNQGYGYDKNGNIIQDVFGSQTRQFIFNGENKQTEIRDLNIATNPSNPDANLIGRYSYDGEGKRVKKVTALETTVFVYSGGKLIAEYSTKLADAPVTNYTTSDHLGTPRIITDELGAVKSRRDYMPFGEDLYAGIGGRSNNAAQRYSSNEDEVQQKFTGYQKDGETNLDFAEARMYNNAHGRFTAVDPLLASGKSANPQTFNRYAYVGNNPILKIDPTGEDWITVTTLEKVGKKTVDVQRPYWIPSGELPDTPRIDNIWSINLPGQEGFQALHPTQNNLSEVFKTREEAVSQYNKWKEELDPNPIIQIMIYESTLFSGAEGSEFKGVVGHVAMGVNNRPYSWDFHGYEESSVLHPTFQAYLDANAKYRTGTLYTLDFGSKLSNRIVEEEIMKGPRNSSSFSISRNGYNMVSNNCGETLCRISERINLPINRGVTPGQHQDYIETNFRQYIINRQRFGPVITRPPNDNAEFNNLRRTAQ